MFINVVLVAFIQSPLHLQRATLFFIISGHHVAAFCLPAEAWQTSYAADRAMAYSCAMVVRRPRCIGQEQVNLVGVLAEYLCLRTDSALDLGHEEQRSFWRADDLLEFAGWPHTERNKSWFNSTLAIMKRTSLGKSGEMWKLQVRA